jgi:hypothetical protein
LTIVHSDLWHDQHVAHTPGDDDLQITPLPPGQDGLPVLAINLALPASTSPEHRAETAADLARYLSELGFAPPTHGTEQLTVSDKWIALLSPVQGTTPDRPDQRLLSIIDPMGTVLFLQPLSLLTSWRDQALQRTLCLLTYDPAPPTTSSNQQQASTTTPNNGRTLAAVVPLHAYDPNPQAPEEPDT